MLPQSRRKYRLPERKSHGRMAEAGFTLIELMVVIMIILILVGMAAQRYEKSVQRAREATLRQDLMVMRQSIDNYTLDKQAAPQSLDDLVQSGYLRQIPVDPITQAKDWVPQYDSVVLSPDQSSTGMAKFDGMVSVRYSGCAGWSSLVARRAHNPKVVSSNLTPATILSDSQGLVGLHQHALLLFGKDLGKTTPPY
jgi:general secretion pathway protein G